MEYINILKYWNITSKTYVDKIIICVFTIHTVTLMLQMDRSLHKYVDRKTDGWIDRKGLTEID